MEHIRQLVHEEMLDEFLENILLAIKEEEKNES